MAQDQDNKLSNIFAATTETENLLLSIKRCAENIDHAGEWRAYVTFTRHEAVQALSNLCVKIVENQHRQDIQAARQAATIEKLEKRLAAIEAELEPKHFNKEPLKPRSPPSSSK
ncbi:MAG: hypothetical protein HY052_06485 [Proteobacteria bacterium]|nr:hypothetical protein [Pseudomonadota bacterium]